MNNFLALLALPLILLNLLGGLIGGVWLLILGEWQPFAIGLLGSFVGPFAIGVALWPGMAVNVPALAMLEKGGFWRLLSFPLLAISLCWTYFIIVVWAGFAFKYLVGQASENSLYPILLVTFVFINSPWAVLAQREGPDSAGHRTSTFLQFGTALYVVVMAFGGPDKQIWSLIAFSAMVSFSLLLDLTTGLVLAFKSWRSDSD